MKTCLIAGAGGYTPENLVPWINSIKNTNYSGDIIVFVYDPVDDSVQEYLKDNGVKVITYGWQKETNIATQRFLDYANLLSSDHGKDYDYVISVDIRDVIFQKDPDK